MTKDTRTERQILDDILNTKEIPFARTPYNYNRDKASDNSGLKCEDPTKTQQQFREESDINTIVKRFNLTGQLPEVSAPQYADYEGIFDFQTALNTVRAAQEDFMQLPAATRARFDNDPQKLLEFVTKEDNYADAVKLGLILPEKAQERAKALQEERNTKERAEQQKADKAAQDALERAQKDAKK